MTDGAQVVDKRAARLAQIEVDWKAAMKTNNAAAMSAWGVQNGKLLLYYARARDDVKP